MTSATDEQERIAEGEIKEYLNNQIMKLDEEILDLQGKDEYTGISIRLIQKGELEKLWRMIE